ncbi:hypothetical protein BJV74DRAFT_261425 [Russula compacta]|nr:hypothetical protein BJV74DRAFT_261425 [Russula compacta]
MLSHTAERPLCLIVDALDERPNNSGMPASREPLGLVKDLVGLQLSNLYRTRVEEKDILNYITSVVFSDTKMRRWHEEDTRLVVETLFENKPTESKCTVFDVLCVREILAELPETLDETYGRMLREINKGNVEQTRCLLHCVTTAVGLLGVKELAEGLADNSDAKKGNPKSNPGLAIGGRRMNKRQCCQHARV